MRSALVAAVWEDQKQKRSQRRAGVAANHRDIPTTDPLDEAPQVATRGDHPLTVVNTAYLCLDPGTERLHSDRKARPIDPAILFHQRHLLRPCGVARL